LLYNVAISFVVTSLKRVKKIYSPTNTFQAKSAKASEDKAQDIFTFEVRDCH